MGNRNISGAGCEIDSHLTLDVRYSYQLPSIGALDTAGTIIVGAINATDEDPPAVAMDMGYDTTPPMMLVGGYFMSGTT